MNTRDVLAAAGVGAALAFILDPNGGARRRALVRDKMTRATRVTREGLDASARDIGNRARGMAAATRRRLSDEHVSDETLVERVRAKLGHTCSHPRAIDVVARNGEVTLRGPILAHESSGVVAAIGAVRGVQRVLNELESHERGDGIPALQGEGRRGEPALDIMQRNWAPATRALVGAGAFATGVCLAAYARRHASH